MGCTKGGNFVGNLQGQESSTTQFCCGKRGLRPRSSSEEQTAVFVCIIVSSPSESRSTRSQASVQPSSQFAAGVALEDTTSSIRRPGTWPSSSATLSRVAPNSTYLQQLTDVHSQSASLGLSRPPSPLGISVAQHCVQHAECIAESAMSGVGQ